MLSTSSRHMRLLSTFFTARAMVSEFHRRHFQFLHGTCDRPQLLTAWPLYHMFERWCSRLPRGTCDRAMALSIFSQHGRCTIHLISGALNFFTVRWILYLIGDALGLLTAHGMDSTFGRWRSRFLHGATAIIYPWVRQSIQ